METDRNEELKKLIQDCCRKNKKSQEMLYKRFFGYALNVAMIYTKQHDGAIEVVNDSFMKVFSDISNFNFSNTFKSWLRKIIINTAIDRFRKEHKHYYHKDSLSLCIADETVDVISKISADDVLALLNKLSEIQKIIFVLYEIEGYNHEEIGERLHIPVSSSRVYLTRAKKKLRELYRIYFNTYDERFKQG
ncbi:MAG TPA: RNA polymerase sigma factor [Mariniphaga sp.]|nr:RNA polymerase sigma factor [Mariniphaga sp.]